MTVFGKDYASTYDFLYEDKNYEKECDFLESIFSHYSKKRRVKTVLDLGCDTGGHSLILARRGYEVVGVDRSKEMLEIAREKSKQCNLPIEYLEKDITNLKLGRIFDAVISMFAVMSYHVSNSDLSAACVTAKKHAALGGIFVFDCWNGVAVLSDKPEKRVREVDAGGGERIVRYTEPVLDTMNHTVDTRFRVSRFQNGSLISEIRESHLMRYLFPQEIKYFLEVAGFPDTSFCPFLEPEKSLTEKDWNMAVVARLGGELSG